MSHFDTRLSEIERADPAGTAQRAERLRAEARQSYQPVGDAFLPSLWTTDALVQARKRARLHGREYNLSVGWLVRQLEKQDFACAVSGVPFSAGRTRRSHKRPFMPSIDRIDSSGGYTTDNVRIVCVAVNTLLQDWGDEVFNAIMKANSAR